MERKQFSLTQQWSRFLRDLVKLTATIGFLWFFFFFVNSALPYIRPGAEIVYEAKTHVISGGSLFRSDAPIKVVIFGNSQVLTGFQPELFDSLSGGVVSSYNLGLPDYLLFTANLENLCRRGQRPTHVLLMFPWLDSSERQADFFHPEIEDKRVMSALFPFRKLPRNLILFSARAGSRGGLQGYYGECRQQEEMMLAHKGYYFIEGQSHYPGHRLPDGFRLQKDDPSQKFVRSVSTEAPEFHRLIERIEQYDIHVMFVPRYFREGEVAPPDAGSAISEKLSRYPRMSALGPDCWLLPNRYFSDPTHLNEEGAAYYTKRLWTLIEQGLKSSDSLQIKKMPGEATKR